MCEEDERKLEPKKRKKHNKDDDCEELNKQLENFMKRKNIRGRN